MLTSASAVASMSINSSRVSSPIGDSFDDNQNKLTAYLYQLSGNYEMEVDVILKDHCYARPWNWKPENIYVKPTKKLFFPKKEKQNENEEIDVAGGQNNALLPPIDLTRSMHLMDELQKLATFARPEDNEEWEEQIDKILWSPVQTRIFTKVIKILSSERLARLAKASNPIEPIFRRTSVDTAARRFREALASAGWDWRLAQWLHGLLFDHLPQEYLGIYLDILQTLRLKIPQLIDKMIAVQPNIVVKTGSITWETLGSLLKRSWDPVAPSLSSNRLKKLPGNPILIIAPCGMAASISSRQHKWISQLGTLGKVVTVHSHLGLAANRMTMMVCIDQLIQATRTKIQDIRSDCPGRPIILVGFNTGAALACQVAQMEHVTAVICLGFPFATAEGKRGTPDDSMMDIRCPVMFVIGQNATLVRSDDLEALREKMLVETSLVVVGTADDNLRISTVKKISEGITQSMVDRCILNEIGDFLGSILLQPHPLPLRTTMSSYETKNNRKEVRKRRNSTSSSVESEPNSPTIKKSRPNTPVSSGMHVGSSAMLNVSSKMSSFSTQANLPTTGGQQPAHVSTVKRKPRTHNSQKQPQFVEHLVTSRVPAQQNSSENGGITLNIGSLASLAPIGPIRLAPSSVQPGTATVKANPKTTLAAAKVPKIVSTNVPLQNVPKMKAIVSTNNKGFSKAISSNYRNLITTDKNNDAKLVNVFTTTGNQMKLSTATTTTIQSKAIAGTSGGTLSNLLQNGKSSLTLSSGSARVPSSSSILLTSSSSSTNSSSSTIPSTSKVTDDMATTTSSSHAMLSSTYSLETSRMTHITRQVTTGNKNNENMQNTSSGNIIMVENSNARTSSSSVIVPFSGQNSGSMLPLSNKIKVTNKSTKSIPKITVNASNIQRIQKAKPHAISKKTFVNDIDDDLGNILDIPIIFAKDDETINNIEKNPTLSQVAVGMDQQEKPTAKLSTSTKVVLISNRQDKMHQTTNKLLTPTTQTIICPNMSMQNLNQVILQARSQNSTITTKSRPGIAIQTRVNQPAVKYTKIILAKRNSQSFLQTDKTEQVIVAKTIDKMNAPKLINIEKSEHRYAQPPPPKLLTKNDDKIVDEVLEIEDAIKRNVIERSYVSVPGIGSVLPVNSEHERKSPGNRDLSTVMDEKSQRTTIPDLANLQT